MSLKKIRQFIRGPFAGTRVEITPLKKAETLPDGTKIKWGEGLRGGIYPFALTETQLAHHKGDINVHEPQVFNILNEEDKTVYRYEGPSIAQEWKLLHNGERPFYRNMGRA